MAIAIPGSEAEFAALSWLELAKLSDQCATGDGTDYMGLLGYNKPIDVSGVGTVQVKVIGINHDTFTDGSTAGITFQLTDGLSASKPVSMQMNTSDIVTGGWRDSVMRKTNIPALLAALPSDLSSLIKKVTKKSSTSQTGTVVVETQDDLFLLSLVESIGTNKTAYKANPITSSTYMVNEGSQYEYYKQFDSNKTEAFNHHIIKADSGSAYDWWLRSIYWNDSGGFYDMLTNGDWSYSVASIPCLPAAGFCIAPPPPPPPLYLAGDWKGENNDQPKTPAWIDADTEHQFLDETGSWSIIGSTPPSMNSPEGVLAIAEAAQSDPEGTYEKFKDKLTPAISFGDMSCQFRLVGVGQDTATDNPDQILLTFLAEASLGTSGMAETSTNANGYNSAATTMKTTLSNLYDSMDSSWKNLIVPVTKEYGTSLTTKNTMTNQTLWIPSMYEVGLSNTSSYEPDCGTTYTYFIGESATGASDKRTGRGQYSNGFWWLRSGCFSDSKYFAIVYSTGNLESDYASDSLGVVLGFCVGPGGGSLRLTTSRWMM